MKSLLDGGCFFEGPRWHDGHWWVSDLYSHAVLKVTETGIAEVAAQVPGQPSGLGFLPDGSLLVVSMKDSRLMRRLPNGRLAVHADLTPYTGGYANDMVVDRVGRAYVGNLGFDLFGGAAPRPANVVCVATDGTVHEVARDLLFPNGMTISADGYTMVVAESFGARLSAFTIASDGALLDQRIWAPLGRAPEWTSTEALLKTDFIPDGCTFDAAGNVWVADALNGRACCVAEGGVIVAEVHAPTGQGIYSVALGGSNGRSLLACVAPDFDDKRRATTREASLWVYEVAVPRGDSRP